MTRSSFAGYVFKASAMHRTLIILSVLATTPLCAQDTQWPDPVANDDRLEKKIQQYQKVHARFGRAWLNNYGQAGY